MRSPSTRRDVLKEFVAIRDEQQRLAWQAFDAVVETLGLDVDGDETLSLSEQRTMLDDARRIALRKRLRTQSDAWRRVKASASRLPFETWVKAVIDGGCFEAPEALRGAEERAIGWYLAALRELYEEIRSEE